MFLDPAVLMIFKEFSFFPNMIIGVATAQASDRSDRNLCGCSTARQKSKFVERAEKKCFRAMLLAIESSLGEAVNKGFPCRPRPVMYLLSLFYVKHSIWHGAVHAGCRYRDSASCKIAIVRTATAVVEIEMACIAMVKPIRTCSSSAIASHRSRIHTGKARVPSTIKPVAS
jgi:hypothetical protein